MVLRGGTAEGAAVLAAKLRRVLGEQAATTAEGVIIPSGMITPFGGRGRLLAQDSPELPLATTAAPSRPLPSQDHPELLAGIAADHVARAHAGAEDVRHVQQHLVAHQLAEALVHLAEPVQIEDHERRGAPPCRRQYSTAYSSSAISVVMVEQAGQVVAVQRPPGAGVPARRESLPSAAAARRSAGWARGSRPRPGPKRAEPARPTWRWRRGTRSSSGRSGGPGGPFRATAGVPSLSASRASSSSRSGTSPGPAAPAPRRRAGRPHHPDPCASASWPASTPGALRVGLDEERQCPAAPPPG